jgi:excisionase family DNA binding protein
MSTTTLSLNKTIQKTSGLFTEAEAADYLDLAPSTLSVWRATKRYPLKYIKVGRLVRYRRSDLEAWLESRTQNNGSK